MRAIGVMEHGGPDALEIVELPDPAPAPGQVLVRVRAAAVNPTDTILRSGARRPQQGHTPPYVPGMDVAGELVAIGEGTATTLGIGDRVMAIVLPSGSHGGYSELLALPAGSVTRAPAGTTHAEAATLPMNGLTARLTLDLLGLSPGAVLAVTGAAGAYGGDVIELAKADGLTVIADAAPADEELVRSLGADHVVPRGDDVADHIRSVAPDGVDALADGSVQNELLLPAVRDGGGFATVRGFRYDAPRGITIHEVWVRDYLERWEALDRLRALAEAGQITLRVA
ncbi:MAG: NADP-dependent oxidoreductase, partial [Ilumatobacteraceae bacterium]